MKRFMVVALLVIFCFSGLQAEVKFGLKAESRYIFDGVDFAAHDDAFMSMFYMLLVSGEGFSAFSYVVSSPDYFEIGIDLAYNLKVENLNFNSSFFPFAWEGHGETYWGFMVSENVTLENRLVNVFGRFGYAYIPDEDLREASGGYAYLGFVKDVSGMILEAGANYNFEMFTEGRGVGGILGISKSIQVKEGCTITLLAKYYINHKTVNEDESVVGLTIEF